MTVRVQVVSGAELDDTLISAWDHLIASDVRYQSPYLSPWFAKAVADVRDDVFVAVLEDQNGQSVAEINLFPLPPEDELAAGATIVTPLETLLTQQLTLSVDGGAARRYPFTFCNTAGCVARVGFTQDEVNQFKRGARATLRMVPAAAPDQEVVLNVSLTGFTAGIDGLETPGQ